MAMNWGDERYVRLYTRDTPDWLCLSFLAQGLFCLLLRKVNRAGVLDLGRAGRRGVFLAVGHAHQAAMLDGALDELVKDGCVELNGDRLVIPNFLEAQEAEATDKARARKHREKLRDGARRPRDASVTHTPDCVTPASQTVTVGSRDVTPASREFDDAASRDASVTPNQPCRSEPNRAEPASHPANGSEDPWLAGFRKKLAERLNIPEIDIGRDRDNVLAFFRSQLSLVGEDVLLNDCEALARKSQNGVPSSLAWFPGWLKKLPNPEATA